MSCKSKVLSSLPRTRTSALLWAALLGVLVLALSLAWRSIDNYRNYFGMYHDDAIYLVTAKALSEGHGYRIISLPGEPAETKYPIGFPLILSLIWATWPHFPENLPAFEIVQALFALGAAAAACGYLVATGKTTHRLGLVIFSACILNSHYLDLAPMVLSDLPCALLSMIAIWMTECESRRPWSLKRSLLLALVLVAAVTLRSQGVVVLIAALAFLAIRKCLRPFLLVLLTASLLLLPQYLWQLYEQKLAPDFLSFYTNYLAHSLRTMSWASDLRVLAWERLASSGYLQITTYYPFTGRIPYPSLSPLAFELVYRGLFILLVLPLLVGAVRDFFRGGLPGLFIILSAVALSIWPLQLEWRHLMPLLPIHYYLLFRGYRFFAWKLKPRAKAYRRFYAYVSWLAAILFALYLVGGSLLESLERAGHYGKVLAKRWPWFNAEIQNQDYSEAYRWIKEKTRPDDTFVCNNDPRLFLYTGRKAVFPSRLEIWRFARSDLVDAGSLLEAIKFAQAKYVIIEPTYMAQGLGTAQLNLSMLALAGRYPTALNPSFASSHGLIHIFSIDCRQLPQKWPPQISSSGPDCEPACDPRHVFVR